MRKSLFMKAGTVVLATAFLLTGCNILPSSTVEVKDRPEDKENAYVQEIEIADLLKANAEQITAIDFEEEDVEIHPEDGYKVVPQLDNPSAIYHLVYESSDESVCTIAVDGTVTALKEGTATITVTDRFSGVSKQMTIKVKELVPVSEIKVTKESLDLYVGDKGTIEAQVLPEDAFDKTLTWSSSNESVAKVTGKNKAEEDAEDAPDSVGEIEAVAEGKCDITITSVAKEGDEPITKIITVTVKKKQTYQSNPGNGGNGNGSSGNGSSGNGSSGNGGSGNGGSDNGGSGNSGGNSTPSAGSYYDSYAEQVLTLVNQERAAAGLAPLSMNYTLVSGAKVRAEEISRSFSHTRPDGSSCFTAFNVSYWTAGENIAAGQGSPSAVMNSWMNSEGHRSNILNGDYTQIAIACYYDPNTPYGIYWVQMFIGS